MFPFLPEKFENPKKFVAPPSGGSYEIIPEKFVVPPSGGSCEIIRLI